jgi:hypothetical protein
MRKLPPMTPGAAAILQARQRRAQAPGQLKVMQGNPAPVPPMTSGPATPMRPGPGAARPRPVTRERK